MAQTLEVLDVDAFDTHGLLHTQVHAEVVQGGNDLVGVVDGQVSFGFKLDDIVVNEAQQQGAGLVTVDGETTLQPRGVESSGLEH